MPILAGTVLVVVVYGALIRLRGIRRVHLAAFLGMTAAIVSLSYLSVFWHAVVISRLPATESRGLLVAGVVGGAIAAVSGFTMEERAYIAESAGGDRRV